MPAKLYYYRATGRGNQVRLALACAGIEWEDVCPAGFPPTEEDKAGWRAIGGNTTTNVPMLQLEDGRVFTQSSAVLRAVGRIGKLMPSDEANAYLTDKLIADADDYRTIAYKSFVPWGASQETADAFISTDTPLHFGNLERQLAHDFYCGSELTLADITVYDAVTSYGAGRIPGDAFADFPKLKAWAARVAAHPPIAKYLAGEQYAGVMKFDPSTLGK
eukprot:TRINITY_DN14194_c0_g1_i1.p1 TRINITY_DN14194_c0_g1~~TRINITY_DN14194_c0_g1_i1.p1  ORF type:complete len:218 (+),score=86.68 TRINITY_DN14194_c0_g1_i1:46-699(+)